MFFRAHFVLTSLILLSMGSAHGIVQITQTFEVGEDTSDWGSEWVAPAGYDGDAPTFLDESLGGFQAGEGISAVGQEAYREFKNNTAGLDLTQAYSMSMYLQLDFGVDPPASGNFSISNGDYGANAGQIRLSGSESSGNIDWTATDYGSSLVDLGINLIFNTPYLVIFDIDPVAQTYAVTVSRVNAAGVVQETGSASGLAIDPSVFVNEQYGKLLFHVDASAGDVDFFVDNIDISSAVPEPSALATVFGLSALLCVSRRRRPLN